MCLKSLIGQLLAFQKKMSSNASSSISLLVVSFFDLLPSYPPPDSFARFDFY